jgi:acyl-CoA synthetase (AMP-forming)/AMP-acid ligase II
VGLEDKAVIIYTSGTSGNPKGAILTHANLLSDAQAIAEWFEFDRGTRTLCILPLFHNNGQVVTLLAPLWAGGSTVMIKGNISLKSFWDFAKRYETTWSSVIPTILSVLLSFRINRTDETMQGIICGGALLPRRVQLDFEERFKVPIFEGYGLTETTSFSSFNPRALDRRKIGSIGLPLPINEMAILDDNGEERPPREIGEICIRGYNVLLGYCRLPERSAAVIRDGWFHSGDYGSRDEDGFYYIEGRRDDLIIKGGENIYPREIENVLYSNPKVRDCAVVGAEHALWGENLVVFVETVDGQHMDAAEVARFLKNQIADYKIPAEVYFLHELEGLREIPKGPTRKILRKELKKYYETHLKGVKR